jgi:hypothetical protein
MQAQLRRKGVRLQLLWQEYRQAHPEGYHRSKFCQLYRNSAQLIDRPGFRALSENSVGATGKRERQARRRAPTPWDCLWARRSKRAEPGGARTVGAANRLCAACLV